MSRLSLTTLRDVAPGVSRPGYDPAAIATGVVHFGPGAFHRAHQAAVFDRVLHDDPRWGIAAVSLRSPGTTDALAAQDGLYTLAIRDRDPAWRVIGAHRRWIGPDGGAEVSALLADPATRIVTSTVTEKGYCLAGDGTLDMAHPDIVADLNGGEPRSLIGWLVQGLAARRASGARAFLTLCCDNLSGNGGKLRAAAIAFAARRDPDLARWIADTAAFPDTMVDSITPASDPDFLTAVAARLGMDDAAAVQREAFTQWVIGPHDLADGPDLAAAGVTLTGDVRGYERAKLRILNGLHSSLAYLGLALGCQSVADAMAVPALADFVERLAREDIVPVLGHVPGLDADAYTRAVLDRFRNPAIRHLLAQIAWDGSQKLPYRLLDTVAAAARAGRPVARLAVPVAAWMAFLDRAARTGTAIVDPLAARLIAASVEGEAAIRAGRLLAMGAVFPPEIAENQEFRTAIIGGLRMMEEGRLHDLLTRS
ncbi:mannitol dehydrogenase family protein [Sphingomonas sp.]|uniref:mannitol dehydrogenase family protein n=1 Tax=Sphingomonas sp. TaxID=28214 RepID=UPI001ED3C8EF|nr:mannitol dehydrogenase family protein [Sphingomonas sp.]MBX3595007.1 mannitol dehydrogenase family protein [Sphingomonas sp.]